MALPTRRAPPRRPGRHGRRAARSRRGAAERRAQGPGHRVGWGGRARSSSWAPRLAALASLRRRSAARRSRRAGARRRRGGSRVVPVVASRLLPARAISRAGSAAGSRPHLDGGDAVVAAWSTAAAGRRRGGTLAAAALVGPAPWPIVAGAPPASVAWASRPAPAILAACAAGSTATCWARPSSCRCVAGLAAAAVIVVADGRWPTPLILALGGTRSGKSRFGLATTRRLAGDGRAWFLGDRVARRPRARRSDRASPARATRRLADDRRRHRPRGGPRRDRSGRAGPHRRPDAVAERGRSATTPRPSTRSSTGRSRRRSPRSQPGPGPVVVVSDEVGLGIVPMHPGRPRLPRPRRHRPPADRGRWPTRSCCASPACRSRLKGPDERRRDGIAGQAIDRRRRALGPLDTRRDGRRPARSSIA